MAILNNLYPPIVDTYAPTFLLDSASSAKNICKVYFSISLYNVIDDIMNAQVTVVNQLTNTSVLNKTKYPSQIKLTDIKKDNSINSNYKYYIEINKSDIAGGQFEVNQYYKIQIRFTSIKAQKPVLNNKQDIDSWLAANLPYFSEWSTVVLARGISTPFLSITNFDPNLEYSKITTDYVQISGQLTFPLNKAETETLRSYRIRLYNDMGTLLTDSDYIYSNKYSNINEMNYTFKYAFQDGEMYKVTIDYITDTLYHETDSYNFLIMLGTAAALDVTLSPLQDIENGRLGINIRSNTTERFTGNLTIRRTSSESNFTLWEDVHTMSIENAMLNIDWYDCTIKSGVWYYYCAQKRDSLGNRGVVAKLADPIMMILDDMFLDAGGKQLNLKFNPQISSFKIAVTEAKTDTLGAKYPYFKRNGNTYYKTFPISALISHVPDHDGLITTRKNIYGEALELYDEYNEKNRINFLNDYTYERDFREKVMDFLYADDVKLFRSPTEGNILVKLTDINFVPEQTLGRMIYTMNCTAYEVAEATVENCDLYNIQPRGYIDGELSYSESRNGQLLQTIPANTDVLDILGKYYTQGQKEGYIVSVDYLDSLIVHIEDNPYLIKEGPAGPEMVEDIDTIKAFYSGQEITDEIYLGFIVYINNEAIVVHPDGIYELLGEGVKITSLYFPVDTTVNLMYHTMVSQTEDISLIPKTVDYINKIGQLWGTFGYKDSIFKIIWNKYYESYEEYIQSMQSLNDIVVEADPGTVLYIAETGESEMKRLIVGDTALLAIDEKGVGIIGLYFAGIHFEEATEYEQSRDTLMDFRFVDTQIKVKSLEEVKKPIKNGVYTLTGNQEEVSLISQIDETKNEAYSQLVAAVSDEKYAATIAEDLSENKYIWYNNKWWLFTNNHDLLQPVEAIINYTCEVSKGWYG